LGRMEQVRAESWGLGLAGWAQGVGLGVEGQHASPVPCTRKHPVCLLKPQLCFKGKRPCHVLTMPVALGVLSCSSTASGKRADPGLRGR